MIRQILWMVASVGTPEKWKKNSMIVTDEAIKFTSHACEEPLLFMWEKSTFSCNVWSVLHKFVLAQLWRCSSCLFFYHIISSYILVLDVNGVDICRQKPRRQLRCFSHILTIMCVWVHVCVHAFPCLRLL